MSTITAHNSQPGITLTCECCKHTESFATAEDAFRGGWDAPPHFSYVCCNLCPASWLVLGLSHAEFHERWDREGRPVDFELMGHAKADKERG